jgi:hypothetical protein
MVKQVQQINWKRHGKIIVAFDIAILFIFWFMILTDYSWFNNLLSICYSVLVLFVSTTIFFLLKTSSKPILLLVFLFCAPSFVFALASIMLHRYHSSQVPIQVESSPDGTKIVSVYCSTNNGHGGMDHIEIIARNKKALFLQRDIGLYNNFPSKDCQFATSPIHWVNNNKVYVTERQASVSIDNIKWEWVNSGEINGDN